MAWLECHEELLNHPKVAALGQAMGWSRFETVGRLLAFWHWVMKYAPSGDLHKFNDAQLAAAVELNSDDAKKWVDALCSDQSRWVDRGRGTNGEPIFRVHDWIVYARAFLKSGRYRDKPERWEEVEAIYRPNLSTPELLMSNSSNGAGVTREKLTLPNQPNHTNQTIPPTPPSGGNGKSDKRQRRKCELHTFDAARLPENLRVPEFTEMWQQWVAHRAERGPALTERSASMQLRKCTRIGPVRSAAAIEHCIAGGYQGLFESRDAANGNGAARRSTVHHNPEEKIRVAIQR